MEVHVDTDKIRECGNELIGLSVELNEVINVMFDKLNNVSVNSNIWVGDSATNFRQLSQNDRKQYNTFIKNFYSLGKYLVDYSDAMNNIIKGVRKR